MGSYKFPRVYILICFSSLGTIQLASSSELLQSHMALCPCIKWFDGLNLPVLSRCLPYLILQICQQTGWNGQPVSTHLTNTDTGSRVTPVTDSRRLRITFNASVSDVLPWKFTPQQREVRVLPGETALAFYTASNKGDQDIIGVATYSVTPAQVSPYFSKIQCFCFEEQRLNAGETVDMPVFFFIDPDFAKDPAMRGIDTITLSYTFFSMSTNPSPHPFPDNFFFEYLC